MPHYISVVQVEILQAVDCALFTATFYSHHFCALLMKRDFACLLHCIDNHH